REGVEGGVVEVDTQEFARAGEPLRQMRKACLDAAAAERPNAGEPAEAAVAEHEDRIAKLVAREANRIEKSMLDETRKLERQFSQTSKELLAAAERQTSEPAEADRAQHEARLVELVARAANRIEKSMLDETRKLERQFSQTSKELLAAAERRTSEPAEAGRAQHEARLAELVAHASTRVEQALLEEAKKLDVKLSQTREELLAAVAEERSADAKPSAEAVAVHEDTITKLIARETGRIEKILLKQTERLERRLSETHEQLRAAAEREAGQPAEEDRAQHE